RRGRKGVTRPMARSLGENTAPRAAWPEGPVVAGGGGQTPSPAPGPRRGKRTDWGKALEIIVLSAPAVVVFLMFVIFPVVMAAYYGFFKWKGFGPPTEFVGFDKIGRAHV